MAQNKTDGAFTWLNRPPTARQSWSAAALVAVVLVAFGALVPIAGRPLTQLNAFFPSLDAVVLVTDLITAVLLFAQFSISRLRSFLALACGYLFTSLIVIPHALTFSGAFSATGLLGAGPQTGSWIFIFWHIGFAAGLLAYAVLKNENRPKPVTEKSAIPAIACSVVSLMGLVCGLTWLATAGASLLPAIIIEGRISPFVIYPIWLAILMTLAALAALWFRGRSMLDEWLIVVALVSIAELIFSGLLPSVRFSVGFYAGRVFSLITSSIVLIVMLSETTSLYVRLARSNAMLQRERANKLMNLGSMAASIAHEMSQPLGAIMSNAKSALLLLRHAPPDLEETGSALNDIVSDSHRAGEILHSLGALFARTDQGREPIDMNEITLGALRMKARELEAHGVTVHADLTPELPLVMGHRGQLEEVLLNLVRNAIEAMDVITDGSRALRIRTLRDEPGTITVKVQDTGPGIDPEQLDTIFEPFVTTKSQGKGLGLAICQMIIEHHGGRLSVLSDKKKGGALFQFTLPIKLVGDSIGDF